MDVNETLTKLESIINSIEGAHAELASIKQALSATVRQSDLLDEAEVSIMLAKYKLHRLMIVCKAERDATPRS